MSGEQNEPMTEGLAAEYVKEEVSKLMVYKIQAYEQLIEISALKEVIRELLPLAEGYPIKVNDPQWKDEFIKLKAIIDKARKLLHEPNDSPDNHPGSSSDQEPPPA